MMPPDFLVHVMNGTDYDAYVSARGVRLSSLVNVKIIGGMYLVVPLPL
jgi:hypothetical protein